MKCGEEISYNINHALSGIGIVRYPGNEDDKITESVICDSLCE